MRREVKKISIGEKCVKKNLKKSPCGILQLSSRIVVKQLHGVPYSWGLPITPCLQVLLSAVYNTSKLCIWTKFPMPGVRFQLLSLCSGSAKVIHWFPSKGLVPKPSDFPGITEAASRLKPGAGRQRGEECQAAHVGTQYTPMFRQQSSSSSRLLSLGCQMSSKSALGPGLLLATSSPMHESGNSSSLLRPLLDWCKSSWP